MLVAVAMEMLSNKNDHFNSKSSSPTNNIDDHSENYEKNEQFHQQQYHGNSSLPAKTPQHIPSVSASPRPAFEQQEEKKRQQQQPRDLSTEQNVTSPPPSSAPPSSTTSFSCCSSSSSCSTSSSSSSSSNTHDKDNPSHEIDNGHVRTSRRVSYFSVGREFYDDGYSDVEDSNDWNQDNINHIATANIEDRLDFSEFRFVKGREEELKVLFDVYAHVDSAQHAHNSRKKRVSNREKESISAETPSSNKSSKLFPRHHHKRNSKKEKTQKVINTNMVLVTGLSGTGKSTLVKQFIQELNARSSSNTKTQALPTPDTSGIGNSGDDGSYNDGHHVSHRVRQDETVEKRPTKPYFLFGKYDELSVGDPYSAIVEAFSGFAQSLLLDLEDQGEEIAEMELQRIRSNIRAAMGEQEALIMATMVPGLKDLIFPPSSTTAISQLLFSSTPTLAGATPGNEVESQDKSFDDADDFNNNTNPPSILPSATAEPTPTTSQPTPLNNGSSENAWNRLKYIFQVFSNAISTSQRPIIMFLDDLQWSDSASLELIQDLMTDKSLEYFMFVGAYRSNDIQPGDELSTRIEAIRKVQDIQMIELANLSLNELYNFISDALKKQEQQDDKEEDQNDDGAQIRRKEREDQVMSLANVIYLKTSGNIFFAVQLLEELQRKRILIFSRVTFQWEWNIDTTSTNCLDDLVSDDVLAAVTLKISSTPELLQKALITMAYTRSTVDFDTIQELLELSDRDFESDRSDTSTKGHRPSQSAEQQRRRLEKLLEKAVLEGFLTNRIGSDSYSFAHDRIQQAAHEMIPVGPARDKFRLQIGHRLYKIAASSSLTSKSDSSPSNATPGKDWLLFAAADHLNNTAMQVNMIEKDPLFLTKINLDAGSRAASIAAYETASKFYGLAMRSLLEQVKNPWETEYDLTLEIYRGIATSELIQGHMEIGRGIADRVIDHARTIDDKLPIQIALAKALGRENRQYESYKLSVAALRELGHFPKRSIAVNFTLVKDLMYVKKYFRNHSDEDFLSLPLVKDEKLNCIMDLLYTFGIQAHYRKKLPEFMASILKQIRLTIKHGLFPASANGMIGYCLFNQAIDDQEAAERSTRLARRIAEITKSKEALVFQSFLAAYFVHAWKDPHELVIEVYTSGNKAGLEAGDFENAMLCSTACGLYKLISGFPLQQMDFEFLQILDKLARYKVEVFVPVIKQDRVATQLLLGTKPLDLDELQNFGFTKRDDSENYKVLYGSFARMQLGVYFGYYELTIKMYDLVEPLKEMDEGYTGLTIRLVFGALAYTALARKSMGANELNDNNTKINKRAYLRKARCLSKELKRLCKIRGMKCFHRHLIIEALIKAVDLSGGKSSNSSSTLPKVFEHAISSAERSGNPHDAALGAHLAAEHFCFLRGIIPSTDPLHYDLHGLIEENITKARDLYLQWGAKGLVKHLETIYRGFLTPTLGLLKEDDSATGDTSAYGMSFPTMEEGGESEFGVVSAIISKATVTNTSMQDGVGSGTDSHLKSDDVSVLTGTESTIWNQEQSILTTSRRQLQDIND